MIIVTGGAGFIGSNIVRGLNRTGHTDIMVVDDLRDGHKFVNLVDCDIADYMDKDEFVDLLQDDSLIEEVDAVLHQGACSVTTEWNGRYMMENNYTWSRILLDECIDNNVPFIYASSGAVYGTGTRFSEDREHERPVNIYGYSKFLFDQYVRSICNEVDNQVAGLRYFNVYGRGEQHKGEMASVIYHFNEQLLETGILRLFRASGGYGDGEQLRDFVTVEDVVNVNLWLLENPGVSGIFNTGTGQARSFNDVARAVIAWHGRGEINYIDFPAQLADTYQSYTEADLSALRAVGFNQEFTKLEEGITRYLDWLNK